VRLDVEVEERPVSKVEVRTVRRPSCHVNETVGRAQSLDELGMSQARFVVFAQGEPFGQRRTRARMGVPISRLATTCHGAALLVTKGVAPSDLPAENAP
jgi:hypothetical protein